MGLSYVGNTSGDSDLRFNGFILNTGKRRGNMIVEYYKYRKDQLRVIIGLLAQAKACMPRPYVYEITMGLDDSRILKNGRFIPSTFDPKELKQILRAPKYRYRWTIEYCPRKGLHIHLMVIFSRNSFNPATHWSSLRTKLASLRGVTSVMVQPRYRGLGRFHNLSDDADYVDAIKRFTYQAKVNQKNPVYVRSRSFGSSQVGKVYRDVQCKMDCAALLAQVDERANSGIQHSAIVWS